MTFKPGDKVVLKSGGPEMVVDGGGDETTTCTWFDGKKRMQAQFTTVTLDKSPDSNEELVDRIQEESTKLGASSCEFVMQFLDASGKVLSMRPTSDFKLPSRAAVSNR
jgi:uncharacterized protein YodC (DUF2158 family)